MQTRLLISLLLLTFLSACTDDDDARPAVDLDVPATYDFTRAGQSTVAFPGQQDRLEMATELVNLLGDPTVGTTDRLLARWRNAGPDGEDISPFDNADLNSSTKSVRSKVAASAERYTTNTTETAAVRQDFERWMERQVTEINANREVVAAPGQAGQILDGTTVRYVDARGLEYNQVFGKGLISALMVDQVVNNYLSPTVLDAASNRTENDLGTTADGKPYTTMEHKWDEAYGYVFGLAADPADPLPTLGTDDNFLNKYLGRVDNNSAPGIGQTVYDAFKQGRAAIVAGAYTERDRAADELRTAFSRIVALRAVYYLRQAADQIAAEPTRRGGAFHDLSEAYGFIYGLQFTHLPALDGRPLFTRAESLALIDRLLAEGEHGLWTVSAPTLTDLADDIDSALTAATNN